MKTDHLRTRFMGVLRDCPDLSHMDRVRLVERLVGAAKAHYEQALPADQIDLVRSWDWDQVTGQREHRDGLGWINLYQWRDGDQRIVMVAPASLPQDEGDAT